MNTILHAGCGMSSLPAWLGGQEVRLDIDARCKPDIVAGITDLGNIGEFDAVFCCHCLEHLYPHDVPKALAEFKRVLKPGGAAIVVVPDLENIKPTDDVVYISDAGPITGFDMYYGYRPWVATNPYMAHHGGFVRATLNKAFIDAGFDPVHMGQPTKVDLMAVGVRA